MLLRTELSIEDIYRSGHQTGPGIPSNDRENPNTFDVLLCWGKTSQNGICSFLLLYSSTDTSHQKERNKTRENQNIEINGFHYKCMSVFQSEELNPSG